jgi:hypothetical protein
MKGHVDKSMGIVTLLTELLTKIKPTNPLRLVKCEDHKKRTVQIPHVLWSKY